MTFEFWGVDGEFIEQHMSTVHQHIGSVGTYVPNNVKYGDRIEQITENIVRLAYINNNHESFTGQVRLKSYCDETVKRLNRDGFIGLEILIPTSYTVSLDNRVPLESVVLLLNGTVFASAELCLGQYGQVYALFFRESIPISTSDAIFSDNQLVNDFCKWTICIKHSHNGFSFDNMEIYWIFGNSQNIPVAHYIDNIPMIYVFQYGNTDWSDRLPFQHCKLCGEDHLYTNEFMLDQKGNVVGVRLSH